MNIRGQAGCASMSDNGGNKTLESRMSMESCHFGQRENQRKQMKLPIWSNLPNLRITELATSPVPPRISIICQEKHSRIEIFWENGKEEMK